MATNLFAYTVPGLSPAFISVNRDENRDVEVIVRSVANEGEAYGATASIKLTAEQTKALKEAL